MHAIAGWVMTEDELLHAVMGALDAYGWRMTHHRRSDAAITQGAKGEPDVRGVREGRALWLELKGDHGRITYDQAIWLRELAQVPDAVVRVLRPADLDGFLTELRATGGSLRPHGTHGLDAELRRHGMVVID